MTIPTNVAKAILMEVNVTAFWLLPARLVLMYMVAMYLKYLHLVSLRINFLEYMYTMLYNSPSTDQINITGHSGTGQAVKLLCCLMLNDYGVCRD